MNALAVIAVLVVVTPVASSHAQLPAPPDSELPTGTTVKFWSRKYGYWINGSLLRFAPKQEEQPRCIGIYADTLSGAVTLASVDSLQLLKVGAKAGGPTWVAVSPSAIHARERGCD